MDSGMDLDSPNPRGTKRAAEDPGVPLKPKRIKVCPGQLAIAVCRGLLAYMANRLLIQMS